MMAYAAYLRVYEPVPVFREPDRPRWTAEIRAAIDGAARGEYELAVAVYMRARTAGVYC